MLVARMGLLHKGGQPRGDTKAGNTFIGPCASLQNPSRTLVTGTINSPRQMQWKIQNPFSGSRPKEHTWEMGQDEGIPRA